MPRRRLHVQPRIQQLRSALQDLQADRVPAVDLAGRSEAAVALVLRDRGDMEVLLIRRSEVDGDPWSGHMALPGGRREAGDTCLLGTAVRETREETGLHLVDYGLHLGRLSDVAPNNPRLPPLLIAPHVFAVPGEVEVDPCPREVGETHWIPLSVLAAPESSGTVTIQFGQVSREFPAIQVNDRVVWGLTHRILTEFLAVIRPLDGLG